MSAFKVDVIARNPKHEELATFVTLGTENGITNLSLDPLLCSGSKDSLPARCDTDSAQKVRGKPGVFRTGIDQRRQRLGRMMKWFLLNLVT